MDNKMSGKIRAYVKGCVIGGATMAIFIFIVNSVIFVSHHKSYSAFSKSLMRFRGESKGRGTEQDEPEVIFQKGRPRMILATTNSGFLSFTLNWLESMKRSRMKAPVVIIAEDEDCYKALSNYTNSHPGLRIKMAADAKRRAEGVLKFSSNDYLKFVNKRPGYILHFLKQGYDVLFSDVDIVFLDNPFLFFHGNADIELQMDVWKADNRNHSDIFCAGFVFYRATEATRDFLKRFILRISIEPQTPDQVLLNRLLRDKDVRESVRTRAMDGERFVSGRYYFNETWRAQHTRRSVVMVHNNWIKRTTDKLKRFKDQGLWYL